MAQTRLTASRWRSWSFANTVERGPQLGRWAEPDSGEIAPVWACFEDRCEIGGRFALLVDEEVEGDAARHRFELHRTGTKCPASEIRSKQKNIRQLAPVDGLLSVRSHTIQLPPAPDRRSRNRRGSAVLTLAGFFSGFPVDIFSRASAIHLGGRPRRFWPLPAVSCCNDTIAWSIASRSS